MIFFLYEHNELQFIPLLTKVERGAYAEKSFQPWRHDLFMVPIKFLTS